METSFNDYLGIFWSLVLSLGEQSALLYKQSPPHVASVEVAELQEVIVDVDEAQDDGARNTQAEEGQDYEDLLIVGIVSE